jgi:two-component system, LuxR family, response regulator FixJ
MASRCIYIVDDDKLVREGLQFLLSTQPDLLVFPCRSGDDFLAGIEDKPGGCVLLDYKMPGTSGLEVLRQVAEMKPKFATIMLTGQGEIAIAVQALKLGAFDFLEKPCNPAVLIQVVEQACTALEEDQRAQAVVQDARDTIARLTPRERDVLAGLLEGRANKAIGYDLDISPRTVEIHRANLMDKLGVRSLSEALRIAISAGFSVPA